MAYQTGDLKVTNTNESKTLGGGVGGEAKEEEDRFGDELRNDQKEEKEEVVETDNFEAAGEVRTSEEAEEKGEVNVVLPTKEEKLEKQRMKQAEKEGTEENNPVEEKREDIEPPKVIATVLLEEPVLAEYASNNYWRQQLIQDIKELEADF